jgi:hypothetical protein
MKFAHYITVLERDAPPQWRGKFVKYKQLKKMLKRCKPADQPDAPLDTEAEEAFFTELHSELDAINRDFQLEADRTVAAYHRSTQGFRLLCCYIPLCCFSGPKKYAALSERAYWCRKYARGNAVALRKILKKHDKVCGNRRGREFLQQCWCSTSAAGIGLFLHSPLLDELKAVQDVLHQKITEIEIRNLEKAEAERSSKDLQDDLHNGDDDFNGDDSDMPSDGEHRHSSTRSGGTNKNLIESNKIKNNQESSAGRTLPPSPFVTTNATEATGGGESASSIVVGLPPRPPPGSNTSAWGSIDLLTRKSPSVLSQSSDGLRGAVAAALASTQTRPGGQATQQVPLAPPSMSGSLGSHTSPSLQAQRRAALVAIQESPTCMLDSSDIEWEGGNTEENDQGPSRKAAVEMITAAALLAETGKGALGVVGTTTSTTGGGAGGGGVLENEDHDHLHDITSDAGDRDGIDPDAPLPKESSFADGVAGGGGGGGGGSFPDGGSSGVGLVLGPFRDEELRCPICLDVMYKPVGLGCGHKFCRPCALEAAGFGKAFGAFHNIISYIPARTPCPQCRQQNVYRSAVTLKEVGRLIKSRYPEQWAEAKSEERMKRRESPSMSRERSSSLLGTTPFDLLM